MTHGYRGLAKLGVDEKMVVEWMGEGGAPKVVA